MRTPTLERGNRGVTLLEVIIAMLIIGLTAAGILSAFVFSRKVGWRAGTELASAGLIKQTADGLRMAVYGPADDGLSLTPGVYVDANMRNAPVAGGVDPTPLAALNFPPEFARFQTDGGTAPTLEGHGDGRLIVVEGADENGNGPADEDLDGDGLIGQDFDGDGQTDLRRVRIRVKWTTPSA